MRISTSIALAVLAVLCACGWTQVEKAKQPPNKATSAEAKSGASPGDDQLKKLLNLLDRRNDGEKFDAHRDPALELQQWLVHIERRFSRPDDGCRLKFEVNTRAFDAEELQDILKFQVGGKIKDAIEGDSISTYLRKILALIPAPSGAVFVVRREEDAPVRIPGVSEAARAVEPARYYVEITTRKFAGEFRVFSLKNAAAVDVAKTVHEILQGSEDKTVRCVSDPRTNSVIVSGRPEQLDKVAALIARLDEQADAAEQKIEFRIFALKNARAIELGKTLQGLFQGSDQQAIRIAIDERTNSILVRGRPDQIETFSAMLIRLDEPVEKKGGEEKKP